MVQCSLGNIESFEMKTAKAEVVTLSETVPNYVPKEWTHMDTVALEAAEELISEVTGTFSAESFEFLKDPIRNKARLDAIQAIDIQAAEDGLRLASFDRKTIANITKFYATWLTKIKAEEAQRA